MPVDSLRFEAFPYSTRYSIQNDFMNAVYEACENGQVAVLESPTGTGKSLSLLVGSMTWLRDHAIRSRDASLDGLRKDLLANSSDQPAWVVEHTIRIKKEDIDNEIRLMDERLKEVKEKEENLRKNSLSNDQRYKAKKKIKIDYDDNVDDSQFLPDDIKNDYNDENEDINTDAKAMLDAFDAETAKIASTNTKRSKFFEGIELQEQEPDITKIYFASRTHSQLSQFISEIYKTSYKENARVIPLGSRKNLCINEKARSTSGGDSGLNEKCRELRTASKGARCEYYPTMEEQGRLLEFRDYALSTIRNIEDLEDLGKKLHVCPYYGSRRSIKQAEICTLPYNLLLSKRARESLNISLKGHVVVIDEAHNLIDTILSVHSSTVSIRTLTAAMKALTIYTNRYGKRLRGQHVVSLKLFAKALKGLIKFCEIQQQKSDTSEKILRPAQVVEGFSDDINLEAVENYLRESHMSQKLGAFAEREIKRAQKEPKQNNIQESLSFASASSMHSIQTLLISLAYPDDDGRIVLTYDDNSISSIRLSYQLLNGAEHFKSILDESRAIIMAGGTMHPVNDFKTFLMPSLPDNKFSTLSCEHIIPPENLMTNVINRGPRGIEMDFRFETRAKIEVMNDLGGIIQNLCNLVPDGIVIFFPSYLYLSQVEQHWRKTGLISRLEMKKKIFREPKDSQDVQSTLDNYANVISNKNIGNDKGSKITGSLLFAVVGAKLSEGINFSDSLARCVCMVGLPFPSPSPALEERKSYVREFAKSTAGSDPGNELVMNQCMRSVNQSIGRAIRHKNDWAGLVLIDKRFSMPYIQDKLPVWIKKSITVSQSFPQAIKTIAPYYSSKRKK